MNIQTRHVTTVTIETRDILRMLGLPQDLSNTQVSYHDSYISVSYSTNPEVAPQAIVRLTKLGSNKIGTIKRIREASMLGLKEAKDLVESCPSTIGIFPTDLAEQLKKDLESLNNTVDSDELSR